MLIVNTLSVPQKAQQQTNRRAPLGGKSLVVWRTLWATIALFDLGILIYSYPVYITQQNTLCLDLTRVTCGISQLVPAQMAALDRLHLTLNNYAVYAVTMDLFITLPFLLVGALIFWHRSNDRMGLFVSLLLITFGCFGIDEVHITPLTSVPWPIELFGTLITLVQWPALGLFFYLFPDGRFAPRWSWLLTSLFVIQFACYLWLPYPYDIPHWPESLRILQILVVYGSAAGTQIYRYFAVATLLQRQQIKWLAFGFAATLFLSSLSLAAPALFPSLNSPDSWFQLTEPLNLLLAYISIPASIGIALLRYRLWDIDVLINRVLVYGLLTAILLALYIGLVIGSQALLINVMKSDSDAMTVISTLIVAALFQPLRHRIQMLIDRRFYRSKYDAAHAIATFNASLRNEVNLPQLQEQLLKVVQGTMMPTHVSIWLSPAKQEKTIAHEAFSEQK